MAIYHLTAKTVSRSKGQCVVASSAYRHGQAMRAERYGLTFDYRSKHEVVASDVALPGDAPAWAVALVEGRPPARAAEALWNAVEAFEKRADALLAREIEVALPVEFSRAQNVALIEAFVAQAFTSRGLVADWSYHALEHNPHAHILITTRPLTSDGFGARFSPVIDPATGALMRTEASKGRPNGKLVTQDFVTGRWGDTGVLEQWRADWAAVQNLALHQAGIAQQVDHRSFADRGVGLQPTEHQGVAARGIERDGRVPERLPMMPDREAENVKRLLARPEAIFEVITDKQSLFDRQEMARTLHRYVSAPDAFMAILAKLETSPELVAIGAEVRDPDSGAVLRPTLWSTVGMVAAERAMADRAVAMAGERSGGVKGPVVDAAIRQMAAGGIVLSREQDQAVRHVTGRGRAAAVVGFAGAGKSTMLKAARLAWEASGYWVRGAALAGKAVVGLQEAAEIQGRTLASWEARWQQGKDVLTKRDVLVIDEAGMVGSKQLGRVMAAAQRAGAKVVLVGDAEQLQPIEAGAPFRAIVERIGYAAIEDVRRQRQNWMREASVAFATSNTARAIQAYGAHGGLRPAKRKVDAMERMVADWAADQLAGRHSAMLGHLREDVAVLNSLARERLRAAGQIVGEVAFKAAGATKRFAPGERVVFLQNDAALGVKNGQFGVVETARPGQLQVRLSDGPTVSVDERRYQAIDHGYATTIHKAQGMTVDHVHVLATRSMDRHLAYVAGTRHREALTIHYGLASFRELGGIAQALSRPGVKGSTLDHEGSQAYAEALDYGSRRSLHAPWAWAQQLVTGVAAEVRLWRARGERLAGLARRLAGLAPVQARTGDLWLAPVSQHDQPVGEIAAGQAAGDPAYAKALARFERLAGQVWADPKPIVDAIDAISRAGGESLEQAQAMMTGQPQRFGRARLLKGGLLGTSAFKQAGLLRQMADGAHDLVTEYRAVHARHARAEQERRAAMAVAVPALSAAGVALAQALGAHEARGDERGFVERYVAALSRPAERDALAELTATGAALRQRFSDRAAFDSRGELVYKDRMSGTDAELLTGMRAIVVTVMRVTATIADARLDRLHQAQARGEDVDMVLERERSRGLRL